jgi:tetratricopeptide (TPR) repeat protein
LNNLGVAQLQLNQFDHAEESFTAALALDPDSERSLAGRGQARLALGEFDSAIRDLQGATNLAPDPSAYLFLGKAYAAQGKRELAIDAWQRALQLQPGLTEAGAEIRQMQAQPPK